jgi:hypothetical protein
MSLRPAFTIDFIGVGPQRTGTSWFHHTLSQHPDICLPLNVKETMFFDRDWEEGLIAYHRYFARRRPGQICGELAPTYFDDARVPERIRESSPFCRIIVSLRDPIARTESLFQHHASKGRVPPRFREAVRELPRILESGRYGRHIPRWLDTFGRENVHFVALEDIEADSDSALAETCEFIGVRRISLPESSRGRIGEAIRPRHPRLARLAAGVATGLRSRRLHWIVELGKSLGLRRIYSGGERPAPCLEPADREFLADYFSEDVAYVEALLGRSLDTWRPSSTHHPR